MIITKYKKWIGSSSLILLLTLSSCKKEAPLEPSNKDENYLVVKDNPVDAVDHAIYQFYQSTGIPIFYNDTLARRQVGGSAGMPQYTYIKLAVTYSYVGNDNTVGFTLLNNKQQVLPMLDLLKNALLPKMPEILAKPSILLVDSLMVKDRVYGNPYPMELASYSGFNAIAIKTVNPDTMSAEAQKKYVSSVLGDLAGQQLNVIQYSKLSVEYYPISEQYANQDIKGLSPDGTQQPEDFGFIISYSYDENIYTPSQQTDLYSYIAATLDYTTDKFNTLYADYPLVLQKFNYVKALVKDMGFQLPD